MTAWQRALRGGLSDLGLHVLGMFSVAVAFVCMASALLVVFNLENLRASWARAGRLSAYITDATPQARVSEIERALRATPHVRSVRVVSSEEARRDVLGAHADPMLAELPEKSFPASLEVMVDDDAQATEVEKIARALGSLPAVESVETYASWSERLGSLLGAGVVASGLLSIVVLSAVGSVVASTLRLSMQKRLVEVQVTKLVGATDQYVRGPFVIEGAFQGAIGSLLSILIVLVLFLIVRSRFDGELVALLGVTPRFLPWYAALCLVGTGALLGAGSAHLSLKKLLVLQP